MELDGLINLYKPVGLTSARALDRVRRLTAQRKSGHAGTLDPAAEGVLLILLGRSTKCTERLMELPKIYLTTLRLDVTSDGFDSEGELRPVTVDRPPSREEVEAALRAFVGTIEQVPPARSAVKVGGQPAYKRARRGEAPELRPRPARIDRITLRAYSWPLLEIEICCGRGTYVRAIARDLGIALGTGGCLSRLVRTAIGPYTAADAWTLERLGQAPDVRSAVVPVDRVG